MNIKGAAADIITQSVYQDSLGKTLSERYSAVSLELKQVVSDANSQIANLENKLAGMLNSVLFV